MKLLAGEDYLKMGGEIKSLLADRILVLASGSPRRREILEGIGLSFQIISPEVQEGFDSLPPETHVQEYALKKAKRVVPGCGQGLIIAADTVVVINGTILGKPRDKSEALQMLTRLSGKKHTAYTGVAILNAETGRQGVGYQTTSVTFNELKSPDIEEYLSTREYVDKAGAYGIQGMGSLLVKEIDGDLDNVIGLPLRTVKRLLEEML
jgi:septum formation protein